MADIPLSLIDDSVKARFWAKVDVRGPDDCWQWKSGKRGKGYGIFRFARHNQVASRMSLAMFLGRNLLKGEMACHHCDNPPCVNPNHLFAGTAKDNMSDCVAKGRTAKWNGSRIGEGNPRARLTVDQARVIKASRDTHPTVLARTYRVSRALVYGIWAGTVWPHLEGNSQ